MGNSLHLYLANSYHRKKQFDWAIKYYHFALSNEPNSWLTHYQLGLLYSQINQLDKMFDCLSNAWKISKRRLFLINSLPVKEITNFYHLVGYWFQEQGLYSQAKFYYLKANSLDKNNPLLHYNLGTIYQRQLNYEKALFHFHLVLKQIPDHLPTLNNLGSVYIHTEQFLQAQTILKRALEKNNQFAQAWNNLGNTYKYQDNFIEALKHYQIALENKPDLIEARLNMANTLGRIGHIEKAFALYLEIYNYSPSFRFLSNLAFFSFAHEQLTDKLRFKYFKEWLAPLPIQKNEIHFSFRASKTIKIGYISPDFCDHSAAVVMLNLFKNHNKKSFEITAFADHIKVDKVTEILQSYIHNWQDITSLSSEEVIQKIRNEKIDILVDFAGHTRNNRLPVFAQRAAPIQVTGPGFCNTTGLDTMDYLFADPHIMNPKRIPFMKEKVLYLSSFIHWSPPQETIEIAPLPCQKNGYITLGCGQSLFKVNPTVIDTWCKILTLEPQAVLYMKTPELDNLANRNFLLKQFVSQGINSDRIKFFGKTGFREHLEFWNQIDIGLDPFPYSGGISSCEQLWMGIPFISLSNSNRNGVSILANTGLKTFIAHTRDEYIQLTIQLMKNKTQLLALRNELRTHLMTSVITDSKTYINEVENAYQMIFHQLRASI